MYERDFIDVDEFCVDESFRRQGVATEIKELYKVTARMILRKSTLIKWIDLIEAGYVE